MSEVKNEIVTKLMALPSEDKHDLLKKGFYESDSDYESRLKADLESKDEDALMNIIRRREGDSAYEELRRRHASEPARSEEKLGEVS